MFRKFAPVLACSALLVGGCGGDDGSSGGASSDADARKPLTKAEYVAQGNQICKDTREAQKPLDSQADDLDRNDLPAAGKLLEKSFAVARHGYDELKGLSPPAAEEARVTAYLTAIDRLLDNRARLIAPLRANDRAAVVKIVGADDGLIAKQARLGDALGLDDCSNTFRN